MDDAKQLMVTMGFLQNKPSDPKNSSTVPLSDTYTGVFPNYCTGLLVQHNEYLKSRRILISIHQLVENLHLISVFVVIVSIFFP